MPDEKLEGALQSSAQLSITIALGISALIFALNLKVNNTTLKLMQESIGFILISLLSYYISFAGTELVQRFYIGLSGLVQLAIIMNVVHVIEEMKSKTS